MATKDVKLEEKEDEVVKGTVYADYFKYRQTGKDVGSTGEDSWVHEMKQYLSHENTTEQELGGVHCGTNYYVDGNLYVGNRLGYEIRQADFMDMGSIHNAIHEFSCYVLGNFVHLHCKVSEVSLATTESMFDIKLPYRPRFTEVRMFAGSNQFAGGRTTISKDDGTIKFSSVISGDSDLYIDAWYEIS